MARRFYSGADTTVMTAEGLLKGFFLDDVYTFHGIKYADAERFQMPTAPQPWEGVKDATNYGYICPVSGEPMPTGEILLCVSFFLFCRIRCGDPDPAPVLAGQRALPVSEYLVSDAGRRGEETRHGMAPRRRICQRLLDRAGRL